MWPLLAKRGYQEVREEGGYQEVRGGGKYQEVRGEEGVSGGEGRRWVGIERNDRA